MYNILINVIRRRFYMCGRFLLLSDVEEIIEKYVLDIKRIEYTPKGEVFPSDTVPVIVNEGKKELRLLKWGFTLSFSKNLIINARGETLEEKSIFRNSFYTRRCIIPAAGYFVWKKEGNKKIKHIINLKDRSLFSLAGIYGNFTDKNGVSYTGFTIITVSPNELISKLHDRMPLIIDRKDEDLWLNNNLPDLGDLRKLVKPFNGDYMTVSPAEQNPS
jgi:putative SOS response-associated peptidase YedK